MKKRRTKIIISLALAIPLAFIIFILSIAFQVVSGWSDAGEVYQKKMETFINLPASEHERLIAISKKFHTEQYETDKYITYSTNSFEISSGHEKLLPQEFIDFGFYEVSLRETKLIARMYWLVDSGGEAEINWSNMDQPTITFFQGSDRDVITHVYPKKEE